MGVLLTLVVLGVVAPGPREDRYPGAATVFRCAFDESCDANFDLWPDGWTRRREPGYPHYVAIQICQQPSPVGNRCLRIEMNGGSAAAYGPPVSAEHLFSFIFEGRLKTEGLKYDRAFFSLTFLDERKHPLQTHTTAKFTQTDGWQHVRLGPVSPTSAETCFAVVGVHVEGTSREDLTGAVMCDDLWLGQLPKVVLATNQPGNFFAAEQPIEITCRASGRFEKEPVVRFHLEDVFGNVVDRQKMAMTTEPLGASNHLSLDSLMGVAEGMIGTATWQPKAPGPGFYRARAELEDGTAAAVPQTLSLAVIGELRGGSGGPFGWTLPHGDAPLALPQLSRLLFQSGVRWVKYPLWLDPGEDTNDAKGPESVERLLSFIERLSGRGIRMVGLLDNPPLRDIYGPTGGLTAAEVFAPEPEVWYPSLEPVMARFATRVRWWQLGDDRDTSFVGHPRLAEKIGQVKQCLDRIGQDVNVGVGWDWMYSLPERESATEPSPQPSPWRFLVLSAEPPMTHHELATYLKATGTATSARWVVLEPLPRTQYTTETRADDLARRMIAAMVGGADAVFCPDPFDAEHGLMAPDGTPGELLLVWRTTALLLGGAEYLGRLELPSGSPNQVFARGDQIVMVVWNRTPRRETLYLGEDVRQVDLWGRPRKPRPHDDGQALEVGPLPTFVTGVDGAIARWRLDTELEREQIPSIFGQSHANALRMKNHFACGVSGRVRLVTPENWTVAPPSIDFRLSPGESLHEAFAIRLPYNASSGRQPVRIDVELQAEEEHRFSIYRHLDVGLGDVYLDTGTRLNGQGELEVRQVLINESGSPVSFSCQLFAPQRRRQRTMVVNLAPGRDAEVYRFPDGRALLGQTLWLRAEEIGGPRILNYRFVAEQ